MCKIYRFFSENKELENETSNEKLHGLITEIDEFIKEANEYKEKLERIRKKQDEIEPQDLDELIQNIKETTKYTKSKIYSSEDIKLDCEKINEIMREFEIAENEFDKDLDEFNELIHKIEITTQNTRGKLFILTRHSLTIPVTQLLPF